MKIFYTLFVVAILGFGGYWCLNHQTEVQNFINKIINIKNNIIVSTKEEMDGLIKSAVNGVSKVSLPYYIQNRNYGVSETENICINAESKVSLGGVISGIQKYTKTVTCIVDPEFPSRSFTIIAPSLIDKNLSYCSDQVGFFTVNTSTNNTFKAGLRCK
jgi:hypothetical protein